MDSFIYYIECDNVYDIVKRDIAKFDTSDYPTDNAYGIPLVNKKVSSLIKDKNNARSWPNSSDLGQRFTSYASMVKKIQRRQKMSRVML